MDKHPVIWNISAVAIVAVALAFWQYFLFILIRLIIVFAIYKTIIFFKRRNPLLKNSSDSSASKWNQEQPTTTRIDSKPERNKSSEKEPLLPVDTTKFYLPKSSVEFPPQDKKIQLVSETVTEANIVVAPLARPFSVTTGLHFVGRDITPGRYKITAPAGSGNLTGDDINVILSHHPESFEISSYTTDLETDQRLKISGIQKLDFNPIIKRHFQRKLTPGKWKVGLDIRPGFYSILANEGSGNIYSPESDINEIISVTPADYSEVPSVTAELMNGQTLFTDVPELLLVSL
ncbi:hypothetical protein [Levilactobacillus andaensis]|uniref:hypothetical protein n=1 Tax=Levilactobacillus andaensis TaxID=2799570 RepID=UPI0019421948|nr:hypothetical protein [Levilactobacillus andaensis]